MKQDSETLNEPQQLLLSFALLTLSSSLGVVVPGIVVQFLEVTLLGITEQSEICHFFEVSCNLTRCSGCLNK